MSEQETAVALW